MEPDDPLLEAADQLSDPGTPDVSERFKIQENIKNEAKHQKKHREDQNLKNYQEKVLQEHKKISENSPKPVSEKSPSQRPTDPTVTYSNDVEISTNNITIQETSQSQPRIVHSSKMERVQQNIKKPQVDKISESKAEIMTFRG